MKRPPTKNDVNTAKRLKRRNYDFRRRYGITIEERTALLNDQNGRCACCGNCDPGSSLGWHVDHCHDTKVVRGILCSPCNVALGHVKESVPRLEAMIAYLRKNR